MSTGELTSYQHQTDSGGCVSFHRCQSCQATLYYEIAALPGFVAVPLGVMTNLDNIAPTVEVFHERCPEWLQLSSIEEQF